MYKLEFTHQYLKDLKLARKRGLDETKLNAIIQLLILGKKIPAQNKNHKLTGNYKGLFECHIEPDWLLIYSKNKSIHLITLIRTGSHADLFK